ncbi:MAG: glycoside hydrolase family 57 protein [Bacteroidales bacterium]|nr:glycoside hydrolase family 57 protein [Bacteroidales bacterium]
MRSICFYFQVHQPYRLKRYRFFDIGKDHYYYDDYQNAYIARRVADKCYLPMNQLLLDLIQEYGQNFKVAFSVSGTALDQFLQYTPEVIDSFRRLAETGSVEFLSETYTHSLSALKSKHEFQRQVGKHQQKIMELFNVKPTTFRNTELIYSDQIGAMVADMGFNTMLTEGAKHILGWKSPNYLYTNAINPRLKMLLKNFQLSDDIAFRFSQQSWEGWPLTTEKFVGWINSIDSKEEVINLFMDYETFGEHQWESTGIFEFMRALPGQVLANSNFTFNTPSEVSATLQPVAPIHVPYPISWADEERDLTAWLGNELQDEAFSKLYELEHKVNAINDAGLIQDWEYLQTSDHFYYMCTKWFSDGDVHKYFNPYGSPYEAFINYMNVFSDFEIRVNDRYNNLGNIPQKTENQNDNLWDTAIVGDVTHEFSFAINSTSKAALKKTLSEVKPETIFHALKDVDQEVSTKILAVLPAKLKKQVVELIENAKPATDKQNLKAVNSILKTL